MLSSSLLNSGRLLAFGANAQSFSYRGISAHPNGVIPTISCSSTPRNPTCTIHDEDVLFHPYRINGANGFSVCLEDARVLEAYDDEYNGVIVDPRGLPSAPSVFSAVLKSSLSHWKIKGKKGVWLKIPIGRSELVPIAVQEGFQYHHAEKTYVMMTYWIPNEPCLLPSNASHQVGVGGFVINDNNEVLVVQEKYSPTGLAGFWKIPTGVILESEEIFTGAVREVKEETGIDTEFIEVMAFRHAHNVAFEKSDLFFVCMLRPLSTQIAVDGYEIQAAMWMPLGEYLKQQQIQEDLLFKKITEICVARLGKNYCGLAVHKLASKFDGNMSSLYFNIIDKHDSNCHAH